MKKGRAFQTAAFGQFVPNILRFQSHLKGNLLHYHRAKIQRPAAIAGRAKPFANSALPRQRSKHERIFAYLAAAQQRWCIPDLHQTRYSETIPLLIL
ncbi:hypothetical protein RA29_04240 [Tateyamaria sp. ANG-S1]|nr:hypothetical protein RA29_04240 [Tateyamaria sp. ANG-S1]